MNEPKSKQFSSDIRTTDNDNSGILNKWSSTNTKQDAYRKRKNNLLRFNIVCKISCKRLNLHTLIQRK